MIPPPPPSLITFLLSKGDYLKLFVIMVRNIILYTIFFVMLSITNIYCNQKVSKKFQKVSKSFKKFQKVSKKFQKSLKNNIYYFLYE